MAAKPKTLKDEILGTLPALGINDKYHPIYRSVFLASDDNIRSDIEWAKSMGTDDEILYWRSIALVHKTRWLFINALANAYTLTMKGGGSDAEKKTFELSVHALLYFWTGDAIHVCPTQNNVYSVCLRRAAGLVHLMSNIETKKRVVKNSFPSLKVLAGAMQKFCDHRGYDGSHTFESYYGKALPELEAEVVKLTTAPVMLDLLKSSSKETTLETTAFVHAWVEQNTIWAWGCDSKALADDIDLSRLANVTIRAPDIFRTTSETSMKKLDELYDKSDWESIFQRSHGQRIHAFDDLKAASSWAKQLWESGDTEIASVLAFAHPEFRAVLLFSVGNNREVSTALDVNTTIYQQYVKSASLPQCVPHGTVVRPLAVRNLQNIDKGKCDKLSLVEYVSRVFAPDGPLLKSFAPKAPEEKVAAKKIQEVVKNSPDAGTQELVRTVIELRKSLALKETEAAKLLEEVQRRDAAVIAKMKAEQESTTRTLQAECDRAKQEAVTAIRMRDAFAAQLDEKEKQIAEMSAKISNLESKSKENDAAIGESFATTARAEQELHNLEQLCAADVDKLRSELDIKAMEMEQKQKSLDDLSAKISSNDAEMARLRARVATALAEAQRHYAEWQSAIKLVDMNIKQKRVISDELKEAREGFAQEKKTWQDRIDRLEENLKDVIKRGSPDVEDKLLDMTRQKRECVDKYEEFLTKLQMCETKLARVSASMEAAQKEKSIDAAKLKDLEDEIIVLETTERSHDADKKRLEEARRKVEKDLKVLTSDYNILFGRLERSRSDAAECSREKRDEREALSRERRKVAALQQGIADFVRALDDALH